VPVFVVEADIEKRLIDEGSNVQPRDRLHQVGGPALVPAGPKMCANYQGLPTGRARPYRLK
jgi:hypothetical protein